MSTFKETGLTGGILEAVKELGFDTPTPIQASTIPHILSSEQDLIAGAQTGTGKTAAFGLPSIQKTNVDDKRTQTIVLCPTRELCVQIAADLKSYAKHTAGFHVVAVYGGASIEPQMKALARGAHIVVGTPGRTKDLIRRKKLILKDIKRVVLDEADEMLTMGFKEDLEAILSQTPREKQTLLFSATMSKAVKNITTNYMHNPVEISVSKERIGAENVKHFYYMVQVKNRYELLKRIADVNPTIYGIVFCRTRRETKDIANKLMQDGYNADALHGDLSQAQRDEVMGRFRKGHLQLLVATDVAARGLDVDDLTHVINYNIPDDLEVYVHRSGRTGRAGRSGISIVLAHTRDSGKLKEIERSFGVKFEKEEVPTGKDICTVQLFKLIDKIQKVEVDDQQIEPFLQTIYEKLEHLDREELIKHFVSAEFNRFLTYYKNARDISGLGNEREGKKDRNRDGDRGRGRDRDRGEKADKWQRTDGRKPSMTRLFINVGTKSKLTPARLIGLINEGLDSGDVEVGKIEVMKTFSFFELDNSKASELINALKGQSHAGVSLVIEPSQEKPQKKRSFDKSRPSKQFGSGKNDHSSNSGRGEKKGNWNKQKGFKGRKDRGERN